MKKSNKGQLAIFDALIFLAAASVVSASLLGAVAPSRPSADAEVQGFVERAHSVFLRTTLRPSELTSLGLDIGNNKTLTVFEIVVSGLIMAEETDSPNQRDYMSGCLSAVLDGLFMPGFNYAWKAEHNSTILSISSLPIPRDQPNGSTYASTVTSKMPMHEGDVVLTLNVWRSVE